ncbi:nuclear intron maturase 4, mitochondrial-like [Spinacia oleracea]|uniref:Nuclear intron maturase 4, mitochondrial-like n=1 Tax=Spinacia oleracea TaxID=3562 RepID=A0ABM3RFB7_SPIOL|nr:nuclear intron maturase 4, mitochondrial-like [Spinacia oleracea]
MPLAKSLASLVVESSPPGDVKDTDRPEMGRVGMKRLFEMRVKKRVKQQYMNGRFSDLFMKVVADPKTLMDAYNCIRVCSNIDVATWEDSVICFESLAEDLANGRFDVEANTCTVSTRGGTTKEVLVLPNLKLKVVQEALRIVLEVVYKPHFSKISHGGRSGRGHLSAFKYICKEIPDPDW